MTLAIQLDRVTFAYPRQPTLFRDLTLNVEEGEMVAVTGSSGSGKSTLLYLLGLFLTPSSGEIAFGDLIASGLDDRDRSVIRARNIGFVFQDAALEPGLSAVENVMQGLLYCGTKLKVAEERSREVLSDLGIDRLASKRPGELSGGEAQRVALARALVKLPAVVLADEPTGNLDATNAAVVLGELSATANRGSAVLVVTHDPAVASECTRTVSLTSVSSAVA